MRSAARGFWLWKAMVAGLMLPVPHPAPAKALRTFDVDVRVFCDDAETGTGICSAGDGKGWASLDAFQAAIEARFAEINDLYRPAQISFRLADFIYLQDTSFYSQITSAGDADPTGDDAVDYQRVHLLHQIAALNPDRITLFLLPRIGSCWSPIPPVRRCTGGDRDELFCQSSGNCPGGICDLRPEYHHGLFCAARAAQGLWDANLLAHELGHHLCLSHTFTQADPGEAGSCNAVISHDGDGLLDTPPDPCSKEIMDLSDGPESCADPLPISTTADFCRDAAGIDQVDCHDWCVTQPQPGSVESDSPTQSYCSITCWEVRDGLASPSPAIPDSANVMSYYHKNCAGPYVLKGQTKRVEALSSEQLAGISTCLATLPERAWTDACEGLGDDTDHDGICDQEDVCPLVPDKGPDPDGDGVPQSCDLCPFDPDPTNLDTDGDQKGDACDPDDDNDGCLDPADQHPLDAKVQVGEILYQGCPDTVSEPLLAFEGGSDTDGDGLLDCEDLDDDGDGTPDASDPCPLLPDDDTGCLVPGGTCPPEQAPWKQSCFGPGCALEFDLVLISLVSPEQNVVIDDFQIVGDDLFLGALPGLAISETLGALRGELFDGACREGSACLSLQLWTQGPLEPVAEISSWAPEQVREIPSAGKLLRLTPGEGTLEVARVWGAGLPDSAGLPDTDGDGVPDPADNCLTLPNAAQADRNLNGFGDVCDLDADESGLVTYSEYAHVLDCAGVDLTALTPAVFEPGGELFTPAGHSLADAAFEEGCRTADLDETHEVDVADVALALAALGHPPGPSGLSAPPPERPVVDPLDPDGDFIGIQDDNCPDWANPEQEDRDENDIGDACECGDQTGDGTVNILDILAMNQVIFGLVPEHPLCDANDDGECDVRDILGANAKIFGLTPGYCERYPPPGP